MKPIGTITLNFGMLSLPMSVSTFANYNDMSFKQVDKDGHYIAYKKVCSVDGHEIAKDEIQKAYKIDKEHKIVFSEELIKAIKSKHKDSNILKVFQNGEINNSVRILIEKVFYLTPKKEFEKPYYILRNSMATSNQSILIDFVIRSRKQIGLIEPFGNYLVLLQLLYPEQVRKPELLDELEVSEKDINNAISLLQSLRAETQNIFLKDIKDKYKEEVFQAIMDNKQVSEVSTSADFSAQLEKAVETKKPQAKEIEIKVKRVLTKKR